MADRVRPALSRLALAVLLAAGGVGCSTEFAPQDEPEVYFSLWGYLDAAADTQWVRVTPIRATVDRGLVPLGADVELERVATGERWPMRDSVFAFADGFAAHNLWTTARVRPNETYRVVVRRDDGAETVATVDVPDRFERPRVVDGIFSCPTQVEVTGVDRVVDAVAVYRDVETDAVHRLPKLRAIQHGADGGTVDVFYGDDAIEVGIDPIDIRTVDASVVIAVGTDDWPDLVSLDSEELALPRGAGRIENGVGFVGGVITWELPFIPGWGNSPKPGETPEPCLDES